VRKGTIPIVLQPTRFTATYAVMWMLIVLTLAPRLASHVPPFLKFRTIEITREQYDAVKLIRAQDQILSR